MEVIKTFVLLDLETSGLPRGISDPCKITEISLVAASRQHILDKHFGVLKENNPSNNNFLPRVLNKLNCVVYPCKMIHPMASEASGLTNVDLEEQRPFDAKLLELINNFMERLEKPICLVAHNGHKFDFPILQSELSKINKDLPEHIFCSDTLLGFREVLVDEQSPENNEINSVVGIKPLKGDFCFDPSETTPNCEWSNDDYDAELARAVDIAEKITNDQQSINIDELERKINMEMERIRKMNEHTPSRRIRKPIAGQSKNEVFNINSIRPLNAKEASVKRRLLKDTPKPKRKYNLSSLYSSLTGKELVNAHQAETDTLALLECLSAVGKPILEWLDKNKIPFSSVKRIW